jgi:hypothetical protein
MADTERERLRKLGNRLAMDAKPAGLPPRITSQGFVTGKDKTEIGSSEEDRPRYSGDSLSDNRGVLTGSAMAQMMDKNYDSAYYNQQAQKRKMLSEPQPKKKKFYGE